MNRRQLCGVIGGCVTLTGCTGGCDGTELEIGARRGSGPDAATLAYGELTAGEQRLVEPAITGGEYTDCYAGTVSAAAQRFTDRVGEAATDGTAYLRRDDSYALSVRLGDKLYSSV